MGRAVGAPTRALGSIALRTVRSRRKAASGCVLACCGRISGETQPGIDWPSWCTSPRSQARGERKHPPGNDVVEVLMKTLFQPSLIACALGATACTGHITARYDDAWNPSDPGATTSGGTVTGAGGGGPTTNPPPVGTGQPLDVGRVPIHRLDNTEHDTTVRDLLGVPSTAAKSFIADETLLGFDTIAEAFGMTDAQFEQYYNAADAVTEQAFADAGLRGRVMTCTPP